MKEISLPSGDICLIDDADYEWASQYSWFLGPQGYVARNIRKGIKRTMSFLHQEIMGSTRGGKWCDHINRNKLDNMRSNLRLVTPAQNSRNRNGITEYKGVCFDKVAKRYKASVTFQGKRFYLKYYDNPVDAAKAYDKKARELFGEFAATNFPSDNV